MDLLLTPKAEGDLYTISQMHFRNQPSKSYETEVADLIEVSISN
jgi:hypothetical protein